MKTPAGSKIFLDGTDKVQSNFLLLTNKNTILLGGRVGSIDETCELKKVCIKNITSFFMYSCLTSRVLQIINFVVFIGEYFVV
jgi:hypothetical protein